MCSSEREEWMNISIKIILKISCIVFALGMIGTLTACDGNSGDPLAYFVSFTLDGTSYVLTGGYTANNTFDSGANGSHYTLTDRDTIRIAAVDASLSDMATQGPFIYLTISANATNVPIAPGSYDVEGTSCNIAVDGDTAIYSNNFDTFVLTLTSSANSVGGVIQGTFSGSNTEGTLSLEDGIFSVERLADGSISAPSRFQ
jgi:hypothetical protein